MPQKDLKKRRVLVSAGDLSGDLLLAQVIEALKKIYSDRIEFVGLCGPDSKKAGVKQLVSSNSVAVVGIVEVLSALPNILKAQKILWDELPQVDSVLCVDFPDFNFILSDKAYKNKIPVDYIVAPQVWAWRSGRMKKMKKWVRRLYPNLGFEQELFREAGIDARFKGHPLRDTLKPKNRKATRAIFKLAEDDFTLLLMPGSRGGELKNHLELMIEAWEDYKVKLKSRWPQRKLKAILATTEKWNLEKIQSLVKSPSLGKKLEKYLSSGEWMHSQNSHHAMMASDFGWICSGTATLEAAYYQLPHVLVYRLSPISVWVLKRLSSYVLDDKAFAGLPNIILGREVIPELLQEKLTPQRLALESFEILDFAPRLTHMKRELKWIPKKMGDVGAATRIAEDLSALWESQG